MNSQFTVLINNNEMGTILMHATLTNDDGYASTTVRSRTFIDEDSPEIDAWVKSTIGEMFMTLNEVR